MKPEDVEILVDAGGSAMLLGSGSFGSVFKGLRQGVQPVAVKRLHQADPSEMTLFHKVGTSGIFSKSVICSMLVHQTDL